MSKNADDDARERAEQKTLLVPRAERSSTLPRGHKVQEFVIEQVLGTGGSSVVYLATDTKLDRRVALKEYLPGMLASRAGGGEVVPRLPRFAPAYDKGLQSFINEARLLGSFDHASLVKVYRFWADNGTAYMSMPYYSGITLKKWLTDLGAPPSEKWLRQLAEPLMQALSVLHAQNCLHRDVAPDNILMLHERANTNYLEQAPHPVLLDFGAARRVLADAEENPTAILKSGYSPIEQYDSAANIKQGPWTDVYALAAVLYTAAIGRAPNAAIARAVRDDLVSARVAARGRYSQSFLAAIDAGLTVRPEQRPQTMADWRAWFNRSDPPPAAPAAGKRRPATADLELPLAAAPPAATRPRRWLWLAGGALVLLVLVVAVLR